MSSPFQKKFSAKDPVKGLTMAQLERKSKKEEKRSKKQFEEYPIGNASMGDQEIDYESPDPQKFAGDDGYD
mgnify:FL=1